MAWCVLGVCWCIVLHCGKGGRVTRYTGGGRMQDNKGNTNGVGNGNNNTRSSNNGVNNGQVSMARMFI